MAEAAIDGETKLKIKLAYWSEMAKIVIKIDFRESKIATGGHFVNFCFKLTIA